MLLRLVSLLERLIVQPLRPPETAEEELLTGLTEVTRRTYKRAFQDFQAWSHGKRVSLITAGDYDKALWSYVATLSRVRRRSRSRR